MTSTEPPLLHDLHVVIHSPTPIGSLGGASPDQDGGIYHALPIHALNGTNGYAVEFTLPELDYWDSIFQHAAEKIDAIERKSSSLYKF